ncbi:MAG TPA: hypothetical protein P5205_02855 [Candidatus Paceibacterota bacterium]|nr:hypothetical protein [Verrucomicrobiota bacterium]HSA09287.1 hypothetical protein [Candidatus Paceibacterota bacterium]
MFVLLAICSCPALVCALAPAPEDPAYRQRVEADWARQEKRWGRTPQDTAALRAALTRLDALVANERNGPRVQPPPLAEVEALTRNASEMAQWQPSERLARYHQVRWLCRQIALSHPLVSSQPLAFMKRKRFICQMLHEYLGYFYDYADIAGGGIYLLPQPGQSFETVDLVQSRLPKGNFATLAGSYDGNTLYFAFAARADRKPDFYSPNRRGFQLFEMRADGAGLRQLTDGTDDNFDPCPLPEGSLAFISSRRGGFGRCHGVWEPLPAYTLHKLDLATGEVTCLSFHETNEWHPFVTADGRIIYTRWDYVDRSAANFHGLWLTNPDGTGTVSLFGNYTMRINACYQPRPVPGSHKIAFIAGAHHAAVGGSLVLLDPRRAQLDAESGEDSLDAIERLTPEVCFPEAPGWPSSYFHSPWPLSEDRYLVSFSFAPLPGMGPKVDQDSRTGLYYFDRWGNLELLYGDPEISCMYPTPLGARAKPPVIPRVADATLGDEGELMLADVNHSLASLPRSRTVTQLRIFQVLPKTGSHVANQPRIGYANAESARMFLGSVPVEADGSAYFRAPARKPLYLQAVDAGGRAVQGMRSVLYLQPGEKRGCVGCHEPASASPGRRQTLSQARPPSRIEPGPDGSRPMSYMRLIQPILNSRCVSCHSDANPDTKVILTSAVDGPFVKSYASLRPYVRWYEWGDQSISQIATRPGHLGADESKLTSILSDSSHGSKLELTDLERRAIYLWLDANAPFYGAYLPEDQLAQRKGEAIGPPVLQ